MKIYIILNNANFKMLSKDITICEDFIEPSYTVNFSYQIDDLENETMNKIYNEWNTYFEF